MEIQPIYAVPALKVNNSLVIADLHIGIEYHLMKKGFNITSRTKDMLDCIIESGKDCNHLIILGDVKDSVPGSSKQEYKEIPDFFERLLEKFAIVDIVRGNHDTNLEEFLPSGVKIRPASGMVSDNIGYIHGHMWPSESVMGSEILIMAHNHPAVMFKDGIGKQMTEPCWIKGNFIQNNKKFDPCPESFIVMPAFNRMLGGSPMNIFDEKFLGPVMNSGILDLDNSHIYLLDGVDLGKRPNIMVKGKEYKDHKTYK